MGVFPLYNTSYNNSVTNCSIQTYIYLHRLMNTLPFLCVALLSNKRKKETFIRHTHMSIKGIQRQTDRLTYIHTYIQTFLLLKVLVILLQTGKKNQIPFPVFNIVIRRDVIKWEHINFWYLKNKNDIIFTFNDWLSLLINHAFLL